MRAHGLGNDYLVLDDGGPLSPALVRAVCDRHRGVGGDGMLEPFTAPDADYGVRIWNPDGSVAEKSGNGLRIFARWLADRGAPASFSVSTGPERVRCDVRGERIAVEMGRARFDPAQVPVLAQRPLIEGALDELTVTALSVGNPHCVCFVEGALDALPWRDWGRRVERHPRFPNRTNFQVAAVRGPDRVEIRIWERGAGETLASGSSSCAVAAAAVKTGRLAPGRITVEMPGGELGVDVSPELDLVLEGPVEVVGSIEVDPRWLAAHTTAGSDGSGR